MTAIAVGIGIVERSLRSCSAEATRSSGHFDKKQDAVDAGRKISQNQGTEFYIHGKDGKIQNKDSHGNDPYPPKG